MKTFELLRENVEHQPLMISKIVKQMVASKGIDVWITTLDMGKERKRLTFQTPITKVIDKKTPNGIMSRVYYNLPNGKESWFEFDNASDDEAMNIIEKDGRRVLVAFTRKYGRPSRAKNNIHKPGKVSYVEPYLPVDA